MDILAKTNKVLEKYINNKLPSWGRENMKQYLSAIK